MIHGDVARQGDAIMKTVLDAEPNFASLSIRDLLEARDLYHFHLLNKANVVGTAIGLYLIRKEESWPTKRGEGMRPKKKPDTARKLENSEVRDYSWPCVLVFVREWIAESDFAGGRKKDDEGRHPTDMVPQRLYMPDGRAVPVCVVQVEEAPDDTDAQTLVGRWPASWLGGGFPITTRVQQSEHMATAGCLVSDGHLTYVLTARHACGEPKTPIYSRLRGGELQIGESAEKQLTRKAFSEVYPAFPGKQSYLALDVGLVRVDDVNQWTRQVYGLPAVGAMADLYEQNLTLRLIDQPVYAFGAASGLLRGTVKALFYRYRSVGGYDYIGDFLIAPAKYGANTRHGDSGAVWHLDVTRDKPGEAKKPLVERELRPLAVEWGGQVFQTGANRSAFAVATSLSNVCKLLDVELVTDLDRGVQGYWGRVGHYSIAAFAVDLVGDADLRTLMDNNRGNLSYELDTIRDDSLDDLIRNADFIPLADVPDETWKKFKTKPGGRDTQVAGAGRTTGPEHPNHYADIDIPFGPQGETLRAQCLADDAKFLTVAAWQAYYAKLAQDDTSGAPRDKFREGLLPFRVWQIVDQMIAFARQKDTVRFLAAAGLLAHYVGDACQPLHGSMFADGDPSRQVQRQHPQSGQVETVNFAAGVHSAYESKMLDRFKGELLGKVRGKLPARHGLALAGSGRACAKAVVQLMEDTAATIRPIDLCEAYEQLGASPTVPVLKGLWSQFGDRTADVVTLGIRTLAMVWESAWTAGRQGPIAADALAAIPSDRLKELYQDTKFLESFTLDDIGPSLQP
jgi:hypothetical protein